MSSLPVGILLAAGQGRRFGSNKLLHPVIDGTSMLMHSAQSLVSVLPDTVVVISPQLVSYARQLEQLGIQVVINEQAEQGMGSSIACGVRASRDATGWLIMLADMPYVKTETIALLANKLKADAGMVAPFFEQQRGHPVGFGRRYKDELIALNRDVGARQIIKKYQAQLELLETDDAGVVTDIDQQSDIL
ncbi:MAG: nucleotidyltransferase family protein [Thioalkalispiraceae bacterium]|jgi:molybdenum cofactor cytidylyltransferase